MKNFKSIPDFEQYVSQCVMAFPASDDKKKSMIRLVATLTQEFSTDNYDVIEENGAVVINAKGRDGNFGIHMCLERDGMVEIKCVLMDFEKYGRCYIDTYDSISSFDNKYEKLKKYITPKNGDVIQALKNRVTNDLYYAASEDELDQIKMGMSYLADVLTSRQLIIIKATPELFGWEFKVKGEKPEIIDDWFFYIKMETYRGQFGEVISSGNGPEIIKAFEEFVDAKIKKYAPQPPENSEEEINAVSTQTAIGTDEQAA